MTSTAAIESHADSLIEILAAQCADLEALLTLARRETTAAATSDFEEIMAVVGERATVGERLESYHRQIAEIRLRMGEAVEPIIRSETATRAAKLVLDIQTQDACTRPLLMAGRSQATDAISRLEQGRRGTSAYLRDERRGAIACDQRV